MANVWIVMPAYNEAAVIADTLGSLEAVQSHYNNIVVVDDGSTDRTAERAAKTGRCIVLQHAINRGQGAALQTGMCWALKNRADVIAHFDADGQHDPNDLPNLLKPILSGECDIALGSRFLKATGEVPLAKQILLKGARLFTRWTSGANLTDSHCGLQAYSRRAAERIDLKTDDFGYASEIIEQIVATGFPIREIPVHVRYTDYSRSKGQSSLNAIRIAAGVLRRRYLS